MREMISVNRVLFDAMSRAGFQVGLHISLTTLAFVMTMMACDYWSYAISTDTACVESEKTGSLLHKHYVGGPVTSGQVTGAGDKHSPRTNKYQISSQVSSVVI